MWTADQRVWGPLKAGFTIFPRQVSGESLCCLQPPSPSFPCKGGPWSIPFNSQVPERVASLCALQSSQLLFSSLRLSFPVLFDFIFYLCEQLTVLTWSVGTSLPGGPLSTFPPSSCERLEGQAVSVHVCKNACRAYRWKSEVKGTLSFGQLQFVPCYCSGHQEESLFCTL